VVWRAGVDLNPIDPRDPDARAWLENLVWPGEDDRLVRLRAALDIVAADPVPIVKGDLLDELPGLVEQAPAGATVVVFHSAVITYLEDADRQRFRDLVTSLPCRWISNEGTTVFPDLSGPVEATRPAGSGHFLLSLDSVPVGWAQGHGRSLTWLAHPAPNRTRSDEDAFGLAVGPGCQAIRTSVAASCLARVRGQDLRLQCLVPSEG